MQNLKNQLRLFPHVDLLLSLMGYKLNIGDLLAEMLKDCPQIARKIDKNFINQMIGLMSEAVIKKKGGRKYSYLLLLEVPR